MGLDGLIGSGAPLFHLRLWQAFDAQWVGIRPSTWIQTHPQTSHFQARQVI
jgi:hypothetical protein